MYPVTRQESSSLMWCSFLLFGVWWLLLPGVGTHRFPLVHLQLVYDSGRYRN